MTLALPLLASCGAPAADDRPWIVDRFDDIKVIRYEVPGFENLPLEQKELVYYLSEAAKCGRDILYDQNCPANLPVRRTLEVIYENYRGDRTTPEWKALEKYLKKVWFANGIHHHYSNDKFTPEFTEGYLLDAIETIPEEKFGSLNALRGEVCRAIFDPAVYPTKLNQRAGDDLLLTSSSNYYDGVSQAEAERFYAEMAAAAAGDPEPVSYGLNSQLAKAPATGRLHERTWRVGGMYSPAIERIVYWLEKAASVAREPQKTNIETLVAYYRSGDLKEFDRYNIGWVKDTVSNVDFVNGFIEDYGDPLGRKAAWEGNVNFMDSAACRRTEIISANAQWFEDHSPVDPAFRKAKVKGVSAKVITVAMLGGDCFPSTPIGINLPNADWIRKEYGSKSVTIDNITYAYDRAAHGNGFNEEFVLRADDRERMDRYGKLADDLHTDLHECLGHGSGQLAPGVRGGELRSYTSTLEEARADLFGLYYLGDGKMVELTHARYGSMLESPNRAVRKAAYERMMKAYGAYGSTFAATYAGNVKSDVFMAKAHGYQSAREAALYPDDIPVSVYDNLLKAVHEALPVLHAYCGMRKEAFNIPTVHMYDLYAPMTKDFQMKLTFDEAYELLLEAVAPLGKDYQDVVRSAKDGGWIDVYENKGKTTGAYSNGSAYGVHPYVLLNFRPELDGLLTLKGLRMIYERNKAEGRIGK